MLLQPTLGGPSHLIARYWLLHRGPRLRVTSAVVLQCASTVVEQNIFSPGSLTRHSEGRRPGPNFQLPRHTMTPLSSNPHAPEQLHMHRRNRTLWMHGRGARAVVASRRHRLPHGRSSRAEGESGPACCHRPLMQRTRKSRTRGGGGGGGCIQVNAKHLTRPPTSASSRCSQSRAGRCHPGGGSGTGRAAAAGAKSWRRRRG